jgi:glycosyltransferase involved in cell wall biosynthesis
MTREQERGSIPLIILVWGFSIHAKRRIEVFSQDPGFHVAVISNYRYEIPGAVVHLLPSGSGSREPGFLNALNSRIARFQDRPHKGMFLRICTSLLHHGSVMVRELIDTIQDIKEIRRIINEFKPGVIFLQTLLYPTHLVFFIRVKAPILITFWNGDVIWWAKYTFLEKLFKKQIVRRGVLQSKAVTVNSSTALDACRSIGKNEADIHLIRYPGVDLDLFSPGNKAQARARLQIDAAYVVLWPRGAGYYHNIQTLLKAVPGLVHRYRTILFILLQVIQNDNVMSREIAEWISLHPQYQKNVLCLGSVPHQEMPDYYRVSDVMVSLSSHDSLPNCMLEAMSCKVPLIMGDIPQIREWIVDNRNGYLIPVDSESALSERIGQICEDANNADGRLVQDNRRLIEKEFDSRVIKERVKDLVVKIAEENRVYSN